MGGWLAGSYISLYVPYRRRHERPAGEPGSYALTNLAASSAAADAALGPTTGGGTEAKL